jgi:rubrerythrin
MGRIKVEVDGYICERCGHLWRGRIPEDPIVCPQCKSPYWNIPRKQQEV